MKSFAIRHSPFAIRHSRESLKAALPPLMLATFGAKAPAIEAYRKRNNLKQNKTDVSTVNFDIFLPKKHLISAYRQQPGRLLRAGKHKNKKKRASMRKENRQAMLAKTALAKKPS